MQAQHSAISKLNDRIRQVLAYLEAVKGGQTAWDHEAVRQIHTVAANLPQSVLPELQEELLRVSVSSGACRGRQFTICDLIGLLHRRRLLDTFSMALEPQADHANLCCHARLNRCYRNTTTSS